MSPIGVTRLNRLPARRHTSVADDLHQRHLEKLEKEAMESSPDAGWSNPFARQPVRLEHERDWIEAVNAWRLLLFPITMIGYYSSELYAKKYQLGMMNLLRAVLNGLFRVIQGAQDSAVSLNLSYLTEDLENPNKLHFLPEKEIVEVLSLAFALNHHIQKVIFEYPDHSSGENTALARLKKILRDNMFVRELKVIPIASSTTQRRQPLICAQRNQHVTQNSSYDPLVRDVHSDPEEYDRQHRKWFVGAPLSEDTVQETEFSPRYQDEKERLSALCERLESYALPGGDVNYYFRYYSDVPVRASLLRDRHADRAKSFANYLRGKYLSEQSVTLTAEDFKKEIQQQLELWLDKDSYLETAGKEPYAKPLSKKDYHNYFTILINEFPELKPAFFVDLLLLPRELTTEENRALKIFLHPHSATDKEAFRVEFKEKVTASLHKNHHSAEFTQMLAAYLMVGTRLFRVEPQTTKEGLYANKTVICAEIIAALAFFVQPHVASSAGAITLLVNSLIGTKESHEDSYLKLLVKGFAGADEMQEVAFIGIGEKVTQIKRTLGVTVTDDRIEIIKHTIPDEMKTEPLGIVISWLINQINHQLQNSLESSAENGYYQKIVISTHLRQCLQHGYFSTGKDDSTNDFIRNASFLTMIAAFGDFSPQLSSIQDFIMRNRLIKAKIKNSQGVDQDAVWCWAENSTFIVPSQKDAAIRKNPFKVTVGKTDPHTPISEAAEWEVAYLQALLTGADQKTLNKIIPGVHIEDLNVGNITVVDSVAGGESRINTFEDFKTEYGDKTLEPLPTQKPYCSLQDTLKDFDKRLRAVESKLKFPDCSSEVRSQYEAIKVEQDALAKTLETMVPEVKDLKIAMEDFNLQLQGVATKITRINDELSSMSRRLEFLEREYLKTHGPKLICVNDESSTSQARKHEYEKAVIAEEAVVIIVKKELISTKIENRYYVGFKRKNNGEYQESQAPLPKTASEDHIQKGIDQLEAYAKNYTKPDTIEKELSALLDKQIRAQGGDFNPGELKEQAISYEAKLRDQQKELNDVKDDLKELKISLGINDDACDQDQTTDQPAAGASASSSSQGSNTANLWGGNRALSSSRDSETLSETLTPSGVTP